MTRRATHKRAMFQRRSVADDGAGNFVGDWADVFETWVGIQYLRGSESVMAARLTGKTPVILTVRSSAVSEQITADWRCIIDGRTFNIREFPRPTDDRVFLEMLAEGQVADG